MSRIEDGEQDGEQGEEGNGKKEGEEEEGEEEEEAGWLRFLRTAVRGQARRALHSTLQMEQQQLWQGVSGFD